MFGEIDTWLKRIDLGKYTPVFIENEVGVSDLAHLSDDDLKELGLPLGPRRRIQAALFDAGTPATEPEAISGPQLPSEEVKSVGPLHPESEAQRLQLTVMFADLVGSTEIARQIDQTSTTAAQAAIRVHRCSACIARRQSLTSPQRDRYRHCVQPREGSRKEPGAQQYCGYSRAEFYNHMPPLRSWHARASAGNDTSRLLKNAPVDTVWRI